MNETKFTTKNENNSLFLVPVDYNLSVICSPDGKHIYAYDSNVNQIIHFIRDSNNGQLYNGTVQ